MGFRGRNLGPAWLILLIFCSVCLPAPAGSSCGLDGVVFADGEDGASALIEVVLGSVIKALFAGDEGSAVRLAHTAIRLDPDRAFAALALAVGQQPDPATRGGLGECGIELAAGLQALAQKLRAAHKPVGMQDGAGGGGISALEQVCARYFIAHRPRLAVRWMGVLRGAADAALRRQGNAPDAPRAASAEFQAAVPSMVQDDAERAAAAAVRLLHRLIQIRRTQRAGGGVAGEHDALVMISRVAMLFHEYASAALVLGQARALAPRDLQVTL
ncbi:hypothetical protein T484DRAFT_1821292 [Baffinella frigidus]|nr:hypothetical protein T484DRAFT_1821292 [Cryptophyta sp. CCMP2293]